MIHFCNPYGVGYDLQILNEHDLFIVNNSQKNF